MREVGVWCALEVEADISRAIAANGAPSLVLGGRWKSRLHQYAMARPAFSGTQGFFLPQDARQGSTYFLMPTGTQCLKLVLENQHRECSVRVRSHDDRRCCSTSQYSVTASITWVDSQSTLALMLLCGSTLPPLT